MVSAGFVEVGSPEWASFLQRGDYDVFHTPEYAQIAATIADGEPAAFIARDGTAEMLLPLVIRRIPRTLTNAPDLRDAISPYGLSGALLRAAPARAEVFASKSCESLVKALRGEGIVSLFVRSHPDLSMPEAVLSRFGAVVHHGETVSVDLLQTNGQFWLQTKQRHRTDIRQAQGSGLMVRIDEEFAKLPMFAAVYRENMSRVSASDEYLFDGQFFEELRRRLGPMLHLVVVELEGRVVAGGLFTEVNGRVQYFLSGTSDEFARKSPSKLMLDYVRGWARDRGNRVLHLGGGVGGATDSLFLFKAGFSPLRHPFYSWRVIADAPSYASLIQSMGLDGPENDDGWFPAYRRKGAVAASVPVVARGERWDSVG